MFGQIDITSLPPLESAIELDLLVCLRQEVDAYISTIQGLKCHLCPFRTLSSIHYHRSHLKYHSEKNMYVADYRSPQRAVVRAYFDFLQATTPVAPRLPIGLHLLQHSATLIAQWNNSCSDSVLAILRKGNRPVLVRVLTHNGPQYWVKPLTISCIRHSSDLYYTPRFADLFLSLLLTNEGRVSTSVNALYVYFSEKCTTPGLLPTLSTVWNDIVHDIISHRAFREKVLDLKYKAALAGEFVVITHDETFKTLFSILGQNKMTQSTGEVHALHTFRGYTGCTLGISAQRSTGHKCFKAAVDTIFDHHLSDQVRFLFSDSPIRIVKAARISFTGLLAVGEDPIHLPIRLEYCWGGATTNASARVRQLHQKFNVATLNIEPFWQPEGTMENAVLWPDQSPLDTRTAAEWSTFCKYPFNRYTGYTTYVLELAKIGSAYNEVMARTNNKGITALEILKNGASREHYECLQNSSRLLARLGTKGNRLGTGTTRNEQLHRELKSWSRNLYQSHKGRLQNGFRIFELAKLLTHASAAYSATLTQTRQSKLLSLIAGRMRKVRFFPSIIPVLPSLLPSTRDSLQKSYLETNISVILKRKKQRQENSKNWGKNMQIKKKK